MSEPTSGEISRGCVDVGEEVGRGREKVAFLLKGDGGGDKVLIRYHSEEKCSEFYKAQFYLHRILHLLLPDNFPDVHFASGGGLVVSRIPDVPDLTRAKEIMAGKRMRYEPEQFNWMEGKTAEMLKNPEFLEAIELLEEVGVSSPSNPERCATELAYPVNSAIIEGRPKILELFDPVTVVEEGGRLRYQPTLQPGWLDELVTDRVGQGKLSEETAKEIQACVSRYMANGAVVARDVRYKCEIHEEIPPGVL